MEDMGMSFSGAYAGCSALVTGHTGFKGSWLSLWLGMLGAKVTGFALAPQEEDWHFERIGLAQRLQHVVGDIRDLSALRGVFEASKPEVVFHLAAQSLVRRSYAEPKETFDTNIGGTVNVLECVRNTPSVRAVVIVTSDKCYENRESDDAYRESDVLGGHDPYSASKGAAELVAACYRSSFFSSSHSARVGVATARAGNVIGGGDWAKDRLIADCVRALRAGQAIVIRNPASIRPWQHVLDPLSGYLWLGAKLLEDGPRYAEPFNFGPLSTDHLSVGDLAELFVAGWGCGTLDCPDPSADSPHEAQMLALSSHKAARRLGWRTTLSVREAVEWTCDWYRVDAERQSETAMLDVSISQIREYENRACEKGLAWTNKRV